MPYGKRVKAAQKSYSSNKKGGISDAQQIRDNSGYGASPLKTGMKMGMKSGMRKSSGRKK